MKPRNSIRATVFNSLDPHRVTIKGKRPIEALQKLITAGKNGVTTASDFRAGVRVSDSIFKLRGAGIPIATERESNSDGDGSHARYRLKHRVELGGGADELAA